MTEFREEFYEPGQDEENPYSPERKGMEKKNQSLDRTLYNYKPLMSLLSLLGLVYFLANV